MEQKKRGRPRKTLEESQNLEDLAVMETIATQVLDEMEKDAMPVQKETVIAEPVYDPLADTGEYRFLVNDAQQSYNVQKLRKRCKEWDWRGQLKSGHTYNLPHCVAKWIHTLGYPTYQQVTLHDGTKETRESGWIQRFSCIPMG